MGMLQLVQSSSAATEFSDFAGLTAVLSFSSLYVTTSAKHPSQTCKQLSQPTLTAFGKV